ncbi:L-lactate dehydrogenase complex protein LldF [Faunimonas pinastri]|uniref:L-lactate dehydrogenase complex protein LldF n=1 Tax=Faunimonas pinastri TaxID=1855383 RepID=A0A1H9NT08_9HYPH|nr:LutB/LldF family L-lactate oxidation iron-sulfur protein [Faunimonas pinastri]SER39184.1 L-lactate dehydrogenase complex protein LldF [Faunimonas pinastri]
MTDFAPGIVVERDFPDAARDALANTQLRRNIGKATNTIRAKRLKVVGEMPDWQELREAGRQIKAQVARHLDTHLLKLEEAVTAAGGRVHWARDGEEANRIIGEILARHGAREVLKIKSLTTDETGLNSALAQRGISAIETDLAEVIVQLGEDRSSHILVPAIHRNRAEIREIFKRKLAGTENLSDEPAELAGAARRYLREKFLTVPFAISGANFAVAETGSVAIFESEGNGRMCLTLPKVLISLMGIEKVIPSWRDMEVFLQTLPRSSTAERMNPYNSVWSGTRAGEGPEEFHLVLLDNGRTDVLADEPARETLACIRCSACLNVCPVYERTGGHAYGSTYPGPIGAILTPQLNQPGPAETLPYASSLCGACFEACPVKIDIPRILVHLRGKIVGRKKETLAGKFSGEAIAMAAMARIFGSARLFELAQKSAVIGQKPFVRGNVIPSLPGPMAGWTAMRDVTPVPKQSFRQWWRAERGAESSAKPGGSA